MRSYSINKLFGFYEIMNSGLPHVNWKVFDEKTRLDSNKLWTIRMAVQSGSDFSLPRYVGVKSKAAAAKARELLKKYEKKGLVVYYPYFVALKSGTIMVEQRRIVIEAVEGDLWHLVDENQLDVNIIYKNNEEKINGNPNFFSSDELRKLKENANKIGERYRDFILRDKAIIVEWSFAKDSDVHGKPVGQEYLVFYELRSV